jgi:hypothetical protein
MANTTNEDEIVEKRPSHPIATSCLILAAVGLIGAIAFQVSELSSLRGGLKLAERQAVEGPHKYIFKAQASEFKTTLDAMIAANEHLEIKVDVPGDEKAAGKDSASEKADESAPATEEAPAKAPAKKAPAKAEKAPKADAKAAEEPQVTDEPKADEPKADELAPEEAK